LCVVHKSVQANVPLYILRLSLSLKQIHHLTSRFSCLVSLLCLGANVLQEGNPKMNQVQQGLVRPPGHHRGNKSRARAKARVSGSTRRIRGSSVHGRGLRVKESRVNVIRVGRGRGLMSRRKLSRVKALVVILSLPNRGLELRGVAILRVILVLVQLLMPNRAIAALELRGHGRGSAERWLRR
jgi:hypothetical protein